MVEKKMEEKVDYTELNFDVDDTEIPLREVSKEEVTAKTTRKKQEKIEVSFSDLCIFFQTYTHLVFFIGKILKLKAVESKIKCVLYIEKIRNE